MRTKMKLLGDYVQKLEPEQDEQIMLFCFCDLDLNPMT